MGNVNPDIQKMVGGWAVRAHFSNCSTLCTRSLVQAARGFSEGYALNQDGGTLPSKIHWNMFSSSTVITTRPWIPFSRSVSERRISSIRALYRCIS